mmetsp:Transcript_103814/g.231861  ORF Transcript_103814/g.231861 Transcript_103814/m.231861 type:complete len:356 (+) Transcript_103814:609-1676(+)
MLAQLLVGDACRDSALLLHPLIGGLRACRAHLVGVGALARVGVVHPLGKEAAMDGHLALVGLSDLGQAAQQRLGKLPWGRHRVRGQLGHEGGDALRGGLGCADARLDGAHEILALVAAADRVQVRRLQAIWPGHDVIGDDDLRVAWVGLVEGAQGAEVVRLLGEAPVAVERLLVELRQADASGPFALHVAERLLQALALEVIEGVVLLPNLGGNAGGGVEVQTLLRAARHVRPLELFQPGFCLVPACVPASEDLLLLVSLSFGTCREVTRQEVAHVEAADNIVHLVHASRASDRHPMEPIGCLQTPPGLLRDEVLEGRRQGCELVQICATLAQPRLDETLEVVGNPFLHTLRGGL